MKRQMSQPPIEELVYDNDEILPEIEIRELLSLEEVLENDPSFSIFTHDEMVQYILEFTKGNTKKSEQLVRMITSHSNRDDLKTRNVMPILKAYRVDGSDFDAYEQRLEEIKNVPYQVRQQLLSQLLYPLQHSSTSSRTFIATKPTQVGIAGSKSNLTVLLPSDKIPEDVKREVYVTPNVTSESYLHERVVATLPTIPNGFTEPPEFSTVLQKLIGEIPDVHTLRHVLLQHGYELDSLDTEQTRMLVSHLSTLGDANDVGDMVSEPTRIYNMQRITSFLLRDFFKVLQESLIVSFNKQQYERVYEGLNQTQTLSREDIPTDIYKIADGIRNSLFTMEDVIAYLKHARKQYIIQESLATLERYNTISPGSIPQKCLEIMAKWSRRLDVYNDRTAKVFMDIYKDIKEVEIGNDTSAYDGNPLEQPEQVFEETQFEYVGETAQADDDATEDIVEKDIDTKLFERCTPGAREVLMPVIRKFAALRDASGVPIDLQSLVNQTSPNIVRISFAEHLEQNVPELGSEIRLQILAASSAEAALTIATNISSPDISERTENAVRQMYKNFRSISRDVFVKCFAIVVAETIEASLEKRLEFDPMNGMLSCIRSWSQFGPPVTKEKEPEGVLYYLACVANELNLLDIKYDDFITTVINHMSIHMKDKVDTLRQQYAQYAKEHTITTSKAKQANISLAEAIKNQLKNRIVGDYVNAMLYIPGMLSGAKHPPHAMGCCMQQLGSDFQADTDWQELKKMKQLKDKFATKRMTKIPSPQLAWIESTAETRDTVQSTYITPVVTSTTDGQHILDWVQTVTDVYLLPQDVIQKLRQNPTSLSELVATNIQVFLNTVGGGGNTRRNAQSLESFINTCDISALSTISNSLYQSYLHASDDDERAFLEASVQHITAFKRIFKTLGTVEGQVDQNVLNYMMKYVVTRAMCLPADTNDVRNRRLVIASRVNTGFLSNTLQSTYKELLKSYQNSHMPTVEEQQAFITRMRELQKVETLRVLNNQTEDDRQIMVDAKKLGLFKVEHPKDVPADDTEQPIPADDAVYEIDGESEFRYLGDDMELADDQLGL